MPNLLKSKTKLHKMWTEFNSTSEVNFEAMYEHWREDLFPNYEIPPFEEADYELNNQGCTYEKFVEFFTLHNTVNIEVPKAYLYNTEKKTSINVTYSFDPNGHVVITAIFATANRHKNIYWNPQLYITLQNYCHAFQFNG